MVSIALAMALRVYRPAAAIGPERMGERESALPLLLAAACGFTAWVGVQFLYMTVKNRHASPAATQPAEMTLSELAFLASVPALLGFAVAWLCDRAIGGPALLARLGLSARHFFRGVGKGLLAAAVIIPPTYFVSALTEMVYTRLHYQHPAEHDLLKAMGETHGALLRWILILSAVAIAPLWEEFLFRGHIQTILRRAMIVLGSLSEPLVPLPGFDVIVEPSNRASPGDRALPFAAPRPARVWQAWASILITSGLFALMHDAWMWPPLFFLAIGLGYSYERTGNLWTSITVHCLFNSTSTFIYLCVAHS